MGDEKLRIEYLINGGHKKQPINPEQISYGVILCAYMYVLVILIIIILVLAQIRGRDSHLHTVCDVMRLINLPKACGEIYLKMKAEYGSLRFCNPNLRLTVAVAVVVARPAVAS